MVHVSAADPKDGIPVLTGLLQNRSHPCCDNSKSERTCDRDSSLYQKYIQYADNIATYISGHIDTCVSIIRNVGLYLSHQSKAKELLFWWAKYRRNGDSNVDGIGDSNADGLCRFDDLDEDYFVEDNHDSTEVWGLHPSTTRLIWQIISWHVLASFHCTRSCRTHYKGTLCAVPRTVHVSLIFIFQNQTHCRI